MDQFDSGREQNTAQLMRRLYREHIRHYLGTLGLAVMFMGITAGSESGDLAHQPGFRGYLGATDGPGFGQPDAALRRR